MDSINRQWLLAARPAGMIRDSDFRWNEAAIPTPRPGEVLVRVAYLSLAPVMRMYMYKIAGGQKPVEIGGVMRGRGVGQVVELRHAEWTEGDIVQGSFGWQDYALFDGDRPGLTFKFRQRGLPISTALGVLGITGYTAYVGLLDFAQPKPGEICFVSGATGGVGSVAGQLAKIAGCRTIALTGGPDKARLALDRLGYDCAIDYRGEDVGERLDALAPDGIDIYFDNIGGATLDLVLARLRLHGRITLCGRISEYLEDGEGEPAPPPAPLCNAYRLHTQRAKLQGFFIYDYAHRFAEAESVMAGWIAEGKLSYAEDIVEGLEQTPAALRRIYEGRNFGKQLVRIAPDPSGFPRPSARVSHEARQ